MVNLRIAICFLGTVFFAALVVLPFPDHTAIPAYSPPLFAFCALFCLACGIWILRRKTRSE